MSRSRAAPTAMTAVLFKSPTAFSAQVLLQVVPIPGTGHIFFQARGPSTQTNPRATRWRRILRLWRAIPHFSQVRERTRTAARWRRRPSGWSRCGTGCQNNPHVSFAHSASMMKLSFMLSIRMEEPPRSWLDRLRHSLPRTTNTCSPGCIFFNPRFAAELPALPPPPFSGLSDLLSCPDATLKLSRVVASVVMSRRAASRCGAARRLQRRCAGGADGSHGPHGGIAFCLDPFYYLQHPALLLLRCGAAMPIVSHEVRRQIVTDPELAVVSR